MSEVYRARPSHRAGGKTQKASAGWFHEARSSNADDESFVCPRSCCLPCGHRAHPATRLTGLLAPCRDPEPAQVRAPDNVGPYATIPTGRFRRFIDDDIARWAPLVKAIGVKLD